MTDDFNTIIISETHWDRAWYLTFEQFRLRLITLVDKLLNILENDQDFKHYTFDGQTVVLEDYLEVKPHNRERISKLIQDGRIDIGPWYILPDEFLVSGESLIRNFLRGKRIANEFGTWMNVGYIPDPFGHISQMPQILSQFSIDSIIFARGTGNESEDLGSEFIWRSSDGSSVLAHWLPGSYGNAANLPDDVEDAIYVLEDVISRMKPYSKIGTYLLMNGSDHLEPQAHLPEVVEKFNASHEDQIVIGTLPMFVERMRQKRQGLKEYQGELRRSKYQNLLSGVYSARIYIKQANEYIQRIMERYVEPLSYITYLQGLDYPQHEINQAWKYILLNHPHDDICGCSIDEVHDDNMQRYRWANEIAESLMEKAEGCVTESLQTNVPGVAIYNPSSHTRGDIAILEMPASNFRYSRLENIELEDPALVASTPVEAAKNEMHIAFVRKNGFDLPPIAERTVKVGDEELTELEFDFQALAMLDATLRRSLRHISTSYLIRVNSQNRIAEVYARKFDATEGIDSTVIIQDESGSSIPLQVLDNEKRKDPYNYLTGDREEYLRLAFRVDDVPALGAKRYDMEFSKETIQQEVDDPVIVSKCVLENGLVSIEVKDDGTITLTDKKNSQVYKGLLRFEDSADVGDSYDYSPIENGTTIFDTISAEVEEGYQGPLIGSLFIRGRLDIPIGLKKNMLERADETVACDFITEITLKKDNPTVHITTVFNNLADDHRLRILFPTMTNATLVHADSTFDTLERPVRPEEHPDWHQPTVPTYPLRSFMSLCNEERGLTITTKGLLEFEVLEEDGGTIALTLVRSVGWLSRNGFATRRESAGPLVEVPGAQCNGPHTFEFAIIPHSGSYLETRTYLDSDNYLNGLRAAYVPKGENEVQAKRIKGIEINPTTMRLSALKRSEDEKYGVLRFWNISPNSEECTIDFGFDVDNVMMGRMDESIDNSIQITKLSERRFGLKVKPKQIVTLLFEPKR